MTNVTVVVGGQYGSEGKGAISAHLTSGWTAGDLAIRVAGPNAGHTVIGKDDRAWKLRSVPVAAVSNPHCRLHIAAGSEVDLAVLLHELHELDSAGYNATKRLTIDPSATILTAAHQIREQESSLIPRVGSTGKGIGAARADRIMRTAEIVADKNAIVGNMTLALGSAETWPTGSAWTNWENILIEGTQGYGLGLHTPHYPQVTSSDCRAIDFLAMTGISPWEERIKVGVVVVARMYPIRVAGNSGPLKDETTWAELGLPEERTTVTNNVRRVGRWDEYLVKAALAANGAGVWNPHVQMALTMLDQRFPDQHGRTDLSDEAEEFVDQLEDELQVFISLVGTGPSTVAER